MSKTFIPRYSRTPNHRWTTKGFSQLSDRDKLALLYAESCPHRHLEGIYTLPPEYACADLGWTLKSWTSALSILQTSGFIKWDAQSKTILLVDSLRYQAPENENQTDGAIRRITDLPGSPLIQEFCAIAWDHCNRKGASRAFKQFVDKLLKQTNTQLPEQAPTLLSEQTPTLLPEQTPTQLVKQGRSLNLKPLTNTKPLTLTGELPAGKAEEFRTDVTMVRMGSKPDDRMDQIGDPLKLLSPSLRQSFSEHMAVEQ